MIKNKTKFLSDFISVVQHCDTLLYHGAYWCNKPTPSGCDRFLLQASTKEGYKTLEEAKEVIENLFPHLEKINLNNDNKI